MNTLKQPSEVLNLLSPAVNDVSCRDNTRNTPQAAPITTAKYINTRRHTTISANHGPVPGVRGIASQFL